MGREVRFPQEVWVVGVREEDVCEYDEDSWWAVYYRNGAYHEVPILRWVTFDVIETRTQMIDGERQMLDAKNIKANTQLAPVMPVLKGVDYGELIGCRHVHQTLEEFLVEKKQDLRGTQTMSFRHSSLDELEDEMVDGCGDPECGDCKPKKEMTH